MKAKLKVALFFILMLACAWTGAAQQASSASAPQTGAPPAQAQANNVQLVIEGQVINVHDGDTITVLDKDKKKFHIRLQGIDAPELKQARGAESQANLSRMVMGKQVSIIWTKVDKYRRTVGTIMLNGKDMNIEQVKAGLAWHFKKYADEQDPKDRVTYARAEEEARAARLGLWQDPNPTPPGDYRVEVKVARWGPPPPEGTVIGNKQSKKYHRPDCPGYRDMAEKNRVFFKSVEEAEAAGYKRAGNCPPESEVSSAKAATVAATTQTRPQIQKTENTPPARSATVETIASTQAGAIIGNKNSKIFHRPNCPGYNNVSEKNQVRFKSVEEAEAAGYRVAKNCPTP
jgi:endonuclease YncB( thermonuclease family)/methylphosphotriester-DNA--protein-cysteine methyltransferase